MGHHNRRESVGNLPSTSSLSVHTPRNLDNHHHNNNNNDFASLASAAELADLHWPFGKIDGIDHDDLRETAYEIFFTACRSSPGFGGRSSLNFYSSSDGGGGGDGPGSPGSPARSYGVGMAVTSKVKRALGLKMLRRTMSRRASSMGTAPGTPPGNPIHHHGWVSSTSSSGGSPSVSFTVPQVRQRRPATSAEIMRLQMRVTEQSDGRLRKTLLRTLVGQMGRRAETIILPLELLRNLKPSEFQDSNQYHEWQKRQLKILETGLISHPAVPLDKSNTHAIRFKEIMRACETKVIDTGKSSETMRALCNSVISLAWRSQDGASQTEVCHWADGYPLNVHIYTSLLQAVFDLKEETYLLDEVDELLELMKKTWSTLAINRSIHNLCFTWVLFHQYVATGQVEADLLCATLCMLNEVGSDAKRADRDPLYVKMLSSVLVSIKKWSAKRLLCYHGFFNRENVVLLENLLPLFFTVTKMLEEDAMGFTAGADQENRGDPTMDPAGNTVDHYIRSSMKHAFEELIKSGNIAGMTLEMHEVSESLIQLAKDTEELAMTEKVVYSPILKKWHTTPAGVAAVTLHACYGTFLKQYLAGISMLNKEIITVLQVAGKLEKVLVQMVAEDSVECEDGGKSIVREMLPYEVDSVILGLLKKWIQERLKRGKECIQRAKETETWNPKSKTEPYAQSAVELTKLAKETVDDFFEIPLSISEDWVYDLADELEHMFKDYTTFVASCGSKQSYLPTLPPLTRCSRDSKFFKLWRKASPCTVVGLDASHPIGLSEGHHPRPSTSRGTQRLYIRLNTLHYLLNQFHSLGKALALSPRIIPSTRSRFNNRRHGSTSAAFFELTASRTEEAIQHVAEVAAYRLIFLDSTSVFYDSLYFGDVENSRIRPALRILKQNLTLLSAIVTDRAQPLAIKEVMRASFEAFLMVLLAGGSSRIFYRTDHPMIEEDFESLKRVFCTCGEGLIAEDVVDREAETVEGIVTLMGQSTEQLVEDFTIVACEASGIGMVQGAGRKLPMPPTTGKWNRSDPNTILRVLCHRNDRTANQFLKRTFQLSKRSL